MPHTPEAQAAAHWVSAAEPVSFPFQTDTQKIPPCTRFAWFDCKHRPKFDQVVNAVCLTIWPMLIGLVTWSMLDGSVAALTRAMTMCRGWLCRTVVGLTSLSMLRRVFQCERVTRNESAWAGQRVSAGVLSVSR